MDNQIITITLPLNELKRMVPQQYPSTSWEPHFQETEWNLAEFGELEGPEEEQQKRVLRLLEEARDLSNYFGQHNPENRPLERVKLAIASGRLPWGVAASAVLAELYFAVVLFEFLTDFDREGQALDPDVVIDDLNRAANGCINGTKNECIWSDCGGDKYGCAYCDREWTLRHLSTVFPELDLAGIFNRTTSYAFQRVKDLGAVDPDLSVTARLSIA